jgi:hypothetical protein
VFTMWEEAGVDVQAALALIMQDRERVVAELQRTGGRVGPIRGFVIPTLHSIGLFSERIRGHFETMFEANVGAQAMRRIGDIPDLPEDLDAWVNEGV